MHDAFGNLTGNTGTWQGPFGYQGDPTGLRLLGHCTYDPSTDRFLTRDPIKDGRNWYSYGGGEAAPTAGADPDGLEHKLSDRLRLLFRGIQFIGSVGQGDIPPFGPGVKDPHIPNPSNNFGSAEGPDRSDSNRGKPGPSYTRPVAPFEPAKEKPKIFPNPDDRKTRFLPRPGSLVRMLGIAALVVTAVVLVEEAGQVALEVGKKILDRRKRQVEEQLSEE